MTEGGGAPGDDARVTPGRPRRPELDDTILLAACRLLVERGYSALTLAEVAKEAHVGRPTVYRRWATKFDLVADALAYGLRLQQAGLSAIDFAALPPRDALTEAVRRVDPAVSNPHAMVLKGDVIGEAERHPELLELLREHAVEPRVRVLQDLLVRMMRAGTIRSDIDPVTLTTMCLGSYIGAFVRGDRDNHGVAVRTADVLWEAVRLRDGE